MGVPTSATIAKTLAGSPLTLSRSYLGEDPSLAGLSSSPLQVLWVTVFPEPQQGSVGGEDGSFQGISHAKELSLPQARLCPAL